MELVIILVVAVVVIIAVIALAARRAPGGSGGAPGEVMADEPLSRQTGASLDDRRHAGPAEGRPGDPGQTPMDPEALVSPEEEGRDGR